MFAIAPAPRLRIPGSTVTIAAKGATKFTSSVERRNSVEIGSVRMTPPAPAMLSRMSMRPRSSSTCCKRSVKLAISVKSQTR